MSSQRNAGLDLIRSIAIILVLIVHSNPILGPYFDIATFLNFPDGVDVFFVLSGFLIGRIIIKDFIKKGTWDLKLTLNFLQRRWFRTLPNYYLFLVINILLVYSGITQGLLNINTFAYAAFLQNLIKPLDLFFWESWSLALEEWFYLLFPIAMLLIGVIGVKRIKSNIPLSLTLFILLPLLYRLFLDMSFEDHSWDTWDLHFRKMVVPRLDSLAIGILGAYVYLTKPNTWARYAVAKFSIGILVVLFITNVSFHTISTFNNTLYFTINSLAILLTFPLLMQYKSEKGKIKPLKFISNSSYSIYLVHLPLMYVFLKYYSVSNNIDALVRYLIYIITTLVLSHLIFRYYETPFKNIREGFSEKLSN